MKRDVLGKLACALLLVGLCEAATAASEGGGVLVRSGLTGYNRIAVLIGVDRYASRDVKVFPDLHGCRTDVQQIGQVLAGKYKFTGLPTHGAPSQPIILLNQEATKKRIMDTLWSVAAAAKKGDQVLIYFSGYGGYDKGQPTLCPQDAVAGSPERDILAGDLYTIVSDALKRKGAGGIVILDTAFLPPRAKNLGLAAAVRQKRAGRPCEAPDEAAIGATLDKIVAGNGCLITACKPGEIAREFERGDDTWMSIFTRFLVEGLNEQSDSKNVDFAALVGTIAPRIGRYVADKFPDDPFNQTPEIHYTDGPGAMIARGVLSTGVAELPKPETDRVRLQFHYFGDDPKLGQSLEDELRSRKYLDVTDQQPEQSLFLFKRSNGLQGYVVNGAGDIVSELSYRSATNEAASVVEFAETKVVNEVEKRAGGLLAFRWPGKLAQPKGEGTGLNVKMVVSNSGGPLSQNSVVQGNDPITVTVTGDAKCFITMYAILPSGDFLRRPPVGQAQDCEPLTPGEPWQRVLIPVKCARYRFLVIAKDRPDVSSDTILRSLWEKTKGDYKAVAASPAANTAVKRVTDKAVAEMSAAVRRYLGVEADEGGPPVPGFAEGVLGDVPKVVDAKYGAAVFDLAIDRKPETPVGVRNGAIEFMSLPMGMRSFVGIKTLGRP
jgi:hypothetical protein